MAISGCEATGDAGGTKTFRDAAVPFTFRLPAEFTKESVDEANSRGDVVAAAGLTKVDVVAVRKGQFTGTRRSRVLGHAVTSVVRPVAGFPGWTLECQYTAERAADVRDACTDALDSVARR